MIPCLPCESARELLEPFVDHELSTAQQVAVETHLRSCPTCSARVDDLALIAWSIRTGTPATRVAADDVRALGVMQSGVLARLNAEQAQSWRVQIREQLSDMRLWWPAMGATAAVIACLFGSATIWSATTEKRPSSMAALLDPGSDSNPLPLGDDMSMPRVLDAGREPETSADDGTYFLSLFVTRTGQVGGAELMPSRQQVRSASAATVRAADGRAVVNAVMGSRFVPAQAADGRAIAVLMLMVIERTTIREKLPPIAEPPPVPLARRSKPLSQQLQLPGARSAVQQGSARA